MESLHPGETTVRSLLRLPDFPYLLGAMACATLANRALAMVAGYQIYALTGSKLSIGLLGLIEAIPALSLVLFGGHVADRRDRRQILIVTSAILMLCAAALGLSVVVTAQQLPVAALYAAMFVAGFARGFGDPAATALEAQVVPAELLMRAAPWFSSTWLICSVAGPAMGGFAIEYLGPAATYFSFAILFGSACLITTRLTPRAPAPHPRDESIWQSIAIGVCYVTGDQVLLGSMALDLFAVFFGGAIALLPVFAKDILHITPTQLGFLIAAPNAGALVTMLIAMRFPPGRNAGRGLLLAVAGFGVSMLVFGLSTSFYLSMIALFFSGVFDGISVVVRKSIVRIFSPDHLRGRIAAVSMVFIGSSNELGALESGLAASWLGTVPSVLAGGAVTLLVVGVTSVLAARLRRLRLDRIETVAD